MLIKKRLWTFSLLLLCAAGAKRPLLAAELNPFVTSWIEAQTNMHSWSADFIQTRTLKSLSQPLTATGQVWFAMPNRFRWELGHPARSIAVRSPEELIVIYPRLKRAEHYPLTGGQTGPWRDALALLEAGFPRRQADVQAQYHILSQTVKDHTCTLVLQPRSAAARRMIPQIKIDLDTNDFSLRATELQFADGSTMRNDFTNLVLNPRLDERLFTPAIPADYKQTEPLKGQ
jgi:outer membrane lipoprotein-sorting protein